MGQDYKRNKHCDGLNLDWGRVCGGVWSCLQEDAKLINVTVDMCLHK